MFGQLQANLGYTFTNVVLLKEALTHPSVRIVQGGLSFNYERFEFLGDAILDFVISELAFRMYPHKDEGFLSSKVSYLLSGEACARVGRSINLGKFLILSKGEEENGGRTLDNNIANSMEALLAAIFYDSKNVFIVQKIVEKLWEPIFQEPDVVDYKTALQEFSQGEGLGLPVYKTINVSGPSHNSVFEVSVTIGSVTTKGTGKSKKAAEKHAAERMLSTIQS